MVVKVCNYDINEALIGTAYRITAITYFNKLTGLLEYTIIPTMDMSDQNSMMTVLDPFALGLIKYQYSSSGIVVALRDSPYRLSSIEIIYNDNDGIPQVGSLYFQESRCWYRQDDAVRGCTDSDASNYNSLATEDDGSCVYTPVSKEDLFRKQYNDYMLTNTRKEYSGGCKQCCCDLKLGRFLARVVESSQRIYGQTVEISPEVQATAVLDFSTFDVSLLENQQTTSITIQFTDGRPDLQLTSFTADFSGMTLSAYLTLVALNINLYSSDFSASYDVVGSPNTISLIAAAGYGAEINNATISLQLQNTWTIGANTYEGSTANTQPNFSRAVAYGDYVYRINSFNDTVPEVVHSSWISKHHKTGATAAEEIQVFSPQQWGPDDQNFVLDVLVRETVGYKAYKQNYSANKNHEWGGVLGQNKTTSSSISFIKSGLTYEGYCFVLQDSNSVWVLDPNGNKVDEFVVGITLHGMDITATCAAEISAGVVRIFCLEIRGTGTWRYVLGTYTGGVYTQGSIIDSSYTDSLVEAPYIIFQASTNRFFIGNGDYITVVNQTTELIEAHINSPSFPAEVLFENTFTGKIYASASAKPGETGTNQLIAIDTSLAVTSQVLPFTTIGGVGIDDSDPANPKFFFAEYGTQLIKQVDKNFALTGLQLDVSNTAGFTVYAVGCKFDAQNNMLIAIAAESTNDLTLYGTSMNFIYVADMSIATGNKIVQNLMFSGIAQHDTRANEGIDVYKGLLIYTTASSGTGRVICNFMNNTTAVAHLIAGSSGTTAIATSSIHYIDIDSNGVMSESGLSLNTIATYVDQTVDNLNKRIWLLKSASDEIDLIDKTQLSYFNDPSLATPTLYKIGNSGSSTGLSSAKLIAVNQFTGVLALYGTPYTAGRRIVMLDPDNLPFVEHNLSSVFVEIHGLCFSNNNFLLVFGRDGTPDAKTALYSVSGTAITLVKETTFTSGVFVDTMDISFDSQNGVFVIYQPTQSIVHIVNIQGDYVDTLDLTTAEWFEGGDFDFTLRYASNGRSYGIVSSTSGIDKLFYIELSPGGQLSTLGYFQDGLDAILDTVDDECLTFEQIDILIDTGSQLIKTCNHEG